MEERWCWRWWVLEMVALESEMEVGWCWRWWRWLVRETLMVVLETLVLVLVLVDEEEVKKKRLSLGLCECF